MHWLRAYYALPFKALAVLVRIYKANRAWLEAHLAGKRAAFSIKSLMLVTLVVWIAIWLFTKDDNRLDIIQILKSIWPGGAK